MSKPKIISIMPATGWVARFEYQASPDAPAHEWKEPLIAWALVEDPPGFRYIAGYALEEPGSAMAEDAAEHPSFRGYELSTDV